MNNQIEKTPSILDRVVQALRDEVRQVGGNGERLSTIAALSARFGVSTNTVRSALTILQQEGLVELRHGSGTYVRQPPALEKHVALMAEIDLLHPTVSYFFREMFRQLRDLLMAAGHDVRLYSGTSIPGSDEPYSTVAGRHLVADLEHVSAVAAFLMLPDEPWIAPVRARGIPIVSNVPELGPAVNSDREEMIRLALQALARSGRRKIGLINWGSTRLLPGSVQDRSLLDLFGRSAAESGVQTHPEWLISVSDPGVASSGWEAFRDLWRASREKPDGLVVTDDLILPGVFDALRSCGVRVPEQLMLASHFNEGSPMPLPVPLIKIEYSPAEHAHAMADLVLAALRGEPAPAAPVLLQHRVVFPDSVIKGSGGTGSLPRTVLCSGARVSPVAQAADEVQEEATGWKPVPRK
jgi:DNA-binding LacI/PurR family transcriptional regulator